MPNVSPLPPLKSIEQGYLLAGKEGYTSPPTLPNSGSYIVNGGYLGNPATNPGQLAPPAITGTGEAGLPIDPTGMGGTGITAPSLPSVSDPVAGFTNWFNTTLQPLIQNYAIEIVLIAVALIALNALFKPNLQAIPGAINNAVQSSKSSGSSSSEDAEAAEVA